MNEYLIWVSVIVASLALGYIFGKLLTKKHSDGSVVLEMTEDGERERVRFVLDLDLDDLEDRKEITLKIDNRLSQK